MSDIRVTFVLPSDATDDSDASEAMVQAYESCKQLVDNVSWARESELGKKKFSKLDYVVFENFEDRTFSNFIETKTAVVGPMVVSVCLMEGKPIPSFQWPMLNVAMYDCQVTCSQISKTAKEAVKNKVQLMGGLYTGHFTSSITHLICNGTKSEKYILAAEKGVKLMLPEWIDHIFEASKVSNINANDPVYLEKYKCLPFHNLTICTTGIQNSKEKAKLSGIISSNGGRMVAKLNLSETDLLVCYGVEGTTSEKFKAARRTQLVCVTVNWVYDSVKKGYAAPFEDYTVKTVTSTPTKEGENIDPNFSTISCIAGTTIQPFTINETVSNTMISTTATVAGSTTKASSKRKASDDLVEKIDIKKVKNAGQFLDGCSIFVAGFSPERHDKLNKIVNLSGATRYDAYSDRISHIIVGDPTCHEVAKIRATRSSCALVSVQWLLDSVEQQRPAKEERYLITCKDVDVDTEHNGSPLSKKALSLLKNTTITPATTDKNKGKAKLQETADEPDDPLTQQYLKNAVSEVGEEDTLAALLNNQQDRAASSKHDSPSNEEFQLKTRPLKNRSDVAKQSLEFKPHETSTQVSQVTSDISDGPEVQIFSSFTFIFLGFDEEYEAYKECVEDAGGTIVDENFKGVADYAITSLFNHTGKLPGAREIVTILWILESIEKECACDIQYYHRPITIPPSVPLKGCVVTISVYVGQERLFLKSIVEELGGIYQEQFSRKDNAEKDVLASTHLVSPEASGKKCEAALKWNIPVVTKDWIMECATTGIKADVTQHLIGSDKTLQDGSKKSDASVGDSGHEKPAESIGVQHNAKQGITRNNVEESVSPFFKDVTVSTSARIEAAKNDMPTPKTPKLQIYNLNQNDSPGASSQVTPVNTVLQRFNAVNGNILPSSSPKTYYPWNPKTPDTPIGAFIRENPSPRLRKEMQKYVNSFPDFVPPKQRRHSTPLSELKRRLRNKVLGIGEYATQDEAGPSTQRCQGTNEESETVTKESDPHVEDDKRIEDAAAAEQERLIANVVMQQKLQELQQQVMANGSASATRRSSRMFEASINPPVVVTTKNEMQSQVCTVDWDYGENDPDTQPQKVFLLSGIDASRREQISDDLKKLGGMVSESNNYDPACTHLICPKPARNEKTLACMAAGKWILHFSFVEKCVKAGKFLEEEDFEFGNPKSRQNITYEEKDCAIHFWRKEVKRRGYGAFNDMRAIVIAEKKEPITNVIEAGGGVVVYVMPPFSDSIHATHCLLELKMVKDFSKYIPLAQQGIKCVNTIYINDFLWRNKKDDLDYIIPYFAKYY